MNKLPEVWLRGPIDGIPPLLQPAAHALQQVREDVDQAVEGLTAPELWARPGGTAAIGFHLLHLAGSLDRLLTYSRGEALSPAQRAALAAEQTAYQDRPGLDHLLAGCRTGIERALDYLRTVPVEGLLQPREVGRQRLPSTTLGLIFHAAEHAARHAGQIATLVRVVRV